MQLRSGLFYNEEVMEVINSAIAGLFEENDSWITRVEKNVKDINVRIKLILDKLDNLHARLLHESIIYLPMMVTIEKKQFIIEGIPQKTTIIFTITRGTMCLSQEKTYPRRYAWRFPISMGS